MIRTFNRWQHQLFAKYFHLPEGTEPLQNRSLQNHPLPNHPLPAAHANDHHAHANDHEPRVLKAWQKSIGNFVERHTAHKESWEIE
jgi:hypothetical protein